MTASAFLAAIEDALKRAGSEDGKEPVRIVYDDRPYVVDDVRVEHGAVFIYHSKQVPWVPKP